MHPSSPSAQLHHDLRRAARTALATRRPVLHRLNADSSWFLQLPRPDSAVRHGARFYYNILIDPWLQGGQSDLAAWFSQQWHATPSAVASIAALEELARESEELAAELQPARGDGVRKSKSAVASEEGATHTFIDAVAISHEFTDHCHQPTLLELHPDVPVFATKEAAAQISSWRHFRTVVPIALFGSGGDTDWRSTSLPPLPDWLGISRLVHSDDTLNLHSALMIAFNNGHPPQHNHNNHSNTPDPESAELLLYTPHGTPPPALHLLPHASPPLHTLALLHGLHAVRIGSAAGATALRANLGAHNGLKAQRVLKARYWIGTHDEVKKGGGVMKWFTQREAVSLGEAVGREGQQVEDGEGEEEGCGVGSGGLAQRRSENLQVGRQVVESFQGVNWVDLGNGESMVLE
ncbi:hypothetical protein LTR08_000309 [Meristemomyces frigidus]|nr:hypothetical protein LTR08_000309 [Meristemomyces frigidus]